MNNELSPELDQRLRIHVERIVRPVRAAGRRKDRMREELLAHATAAYLEERQVHHNNDEAVMAAFNRLGESSELTRELQAGVSWIERVLFTSPPTPSHVQRWFMRRSGESIWRCAARCTAVYGLLLPVGMVVLALLLALVSRDSSEFTRMYSHWPILAGFCTWMIGFCYLSPASAEVVHRAIWGPVKRFGVVAGICLFYFLAVFSMCIWIRWIANDQYFVIGPDLWVWAGAAAVAPVTLLVSSRLGYLEHQRIQRWTGLDLAE